MTKLWKLLSAVLLAIAPLCASAQYPPGGPADIAGTFYASNFAGWTVAQGNNGPFAWSSSAVCLKASSGGVQFQPFVVGSPIRIVDTAAPSNSENVTVTAVNVNGSGCAIVTTTPAHTHYSFYLTSATGGLQEAINFAKQNYGVSPSLGVVIATADWERLGGTTGIITSAKGNANVSILDLRTSCPVSYTWNGSAYTGIDLCTAGGTGILTQTNGVDNLSQILLDLVQGNNVTITNTSGGHVRIDAAAANFEQQVIPPIGGQYVPVYPTVGTITSDPRGDSTIGPQGGLFNWSCSGILCTIAPHVNANWTGFTLPAYVNPANVTAVYADAVSSATTLNGQMPAGGVNTTRAYCNPSGPTTTLLPSYGTSPYPWAAFEGTVLTSITGAAVSSTSCFVDVGSSNQLSSGMSLNIPSIRLLVYYTGPPPPARTAIDIVPPLAYNPALLTLGDTLQPRWLDGGTDTVVQSLTSANTSVAALIINNTSVSGGGFAFVEEGSANTYPGSGGIFNVQTAHFPLIIKPNDDVILSSLGTSTSPICPNGTNGALTTTGCAGGGGGGLSGQTTGYLPLATSATTSTTSSALQDTGSSLIYHGTGTAHGLTMAEGTTLSGLAGSDILMTDATTHRWLQNPNNIGPLALVGTSTTPATSGHCPQYASNGYDIVDSGSACAAGTSFITSLTTTGSSGAATVSSGVLNIPVYTGGSSVLGPLQVPNLFTAVNPPTTLSPFTVQANQTIDGNTKYFSDGTAYNTAGTNYASSGNYIADQTFTCLANPGKCSDTFLLNLITKYAAAVDGNGQLPINLSSTLTPAYYSAFDLHHAFASPDGAIFLPQMLYLYCQKYGLASTQCGTAYTASVAAIKSAWAFYPRNGTTHLFTVVSGNEYLMTTGFEEYVRNTGDVANGNVWYAADMADMAAIATAQADSTNAAFFNSEHSTIVTAIRANLINGTTGLLISATGQNSGNDDIATSSLAVACDLRPSVMAACGVLTSGQKTTIENYFNTNYATITNANGAVLQTPQSAWAQFGCIQAGGGTPYNGGGCPGYTGSQYQGALWFYFNDDFALALGQVNQAKVGTFLNTALNPTSADTAMEWNDRASTAMPSGSSTNYMASNQWEVAVNNAFPLAQTVTAGVGCINKYGALVNSGCAAGSGLIYGTNSIATAATPVVFDGGSTNLELFQMKGTHTTGTRFKLDNGLNGLWFLELGSAFGSYAGSGCIQNGPTTGTVAMQCWQYLTNTTGLVSMMPGLSLKWSNTSADPNQPQATGISQPSAGTLSIDSTTVGNHGGNLTLNNLTINGTCTGCPASLVYGTNNITTATTPVIFSGSTTNSQIFKMTSANTSNTAVFLENTSAGSHDWADLVQGSIATDVGERLWLDVTTGNVPWGMLTTSSTAGMERRASVIVDCWAAGALTASTTCDTGLSRDAAGVVDIGNGTAGNKSGSIKGTNATWTGTDSAALFATATNCSSSASPAVCSAAGAGSVAVASGGSTLTVNTTAVTANSQIQLTFDSSLGTRLGVTCNTTVNQPTVSARTAGTSFTITMGAAVSTNPACVSYSIVN